jgi:hypothetical protein
MKRAAGIIALPLLLLFLPLFATAGAASADNTSCSGCQASGLALGVDTASYKLWPTGSKTLLDVVWTPTDSRASFNLLNSGTVATPATAITVLVDNHDPLTQQSVDAMSYTFSVPSLAPQTTSTVTIPLDYVQCDVFVTIDLGNGVPLVLRTGNPAAC